jgi:flagellar motor protein MotB
MSKREPPEELKAPQWMLTFGDFISLLVTFFVMLIAFSSFEEAKLAAMIGSLKGALGVAPYPEFTMKPGIEIHYDQIKGVADEPRWLSINELSVVMPSLQMAMKRFGAPTLGSDRYVTVAMLEEGMAIII